MEAYEKGSIVLVFYPDADKPYLVTTGDDETLKIWDYLRTFEGHNVSFAVSHPDLPIIVGRTVEVVISPILEGLECVGGSVSIFYIRLS